MLVDELGDVIVFNSMIDALNWMGNLGWKFEQAHTVTESLYKNNVYHFLLSKEITEEQLIDEGIHLIHTMKEPDILTLKEYASKDENKAYIALLMKKQLVDSHHKKELSQIFNYEDILKLIQTKTTEELISLSKNHNKYFEKYKTEYVVE